MANRTVVTGQCCHCLSSNNDLSAWIASKGKRTLLDLNLPVVLLSTAKLQNDDRQSYCNEDISRLYCAAQFAPRLNRA